MKYPIPMPRPIQLQMQSSPFAPPPPQNAGGRPPLMQRLANNSDAFLQMGMGLLSGQTGPEQFALGAQGFSQGAKSIKERREAETTKNKTLAFLKTANPEIAAAVEAGALPVGEAYKLHWQSRQGAKPTAGIQEYEYAKQQGFNGSFMDFQLGQRKAGATNVNVSNGQSYPGLSKLGEGFSYRYNPDGTIMTDERGMPVAAPIPGGKADMDVQETAQKQRKSAENANTATDIVTNAATRARSAAKDRALGPIGQSIVEYNPYTDSAEVRRQVNVLQSTAKVENLNAMRAASPTGGALGNVTNQESQMLADKSGALDPSSPNFQRDLDDYERTLLRVIHGYEAGDRIYLQTRRTDGPPQGNGDINALIDQYAD